MGSLSARRAWIEITLPEPSTPWPVVALRKESVDRNYNIPPDSVLIIESLSARRAWIEMGMTRASIWLWVVALRKESVDRNPCPADDRNIYAVALRKESVDRNLRFGRMMRR